MGMYAGPGCSPWDGAALADAADWAKRLASEAQAAGRDHAAAILHATAGLLLEQAWAATGPSASNRV